MEGATHIGRILGRHHARYGHDDTSILNLLHHSTDGIAEYEQGQVDFVRALSLSEMELEEQNKLIIERVKKETIKAQVEEDEHLANAIQLSIVMMPSTSKVDTSASKICAGCNNKIRRGQPVSYVNGIVRHAECPFLCHTCKQLIRDDDEVFVAGRHYHATCLRKMKYPECYVCNNFVPFTNEGVEYREHPFWEKQYCPSHENDGTLKCYSCEKLQPKGCEYISLKDGRRLCPECFSFIIMDTNECEPIFDEILEFYASLHMKFDQKIPLWLVEREALNEALEGEKNGHHHLSETRGLCLSEEQTIPISIKRKHIDRGRLILDMSTQPRRLVRSCEVTAILILNGLPRLLTGSILAHEMMHAWLRLQGYPNLEPEIEEGICQVLAHMWLTSKIKLGSEAAMAAAPSSSLRPPCLNKHKLLSENEIKLGECFIRQIELDTSSAYGDGFRKGYWAVSKFGLKATRDHIKLTGTFPV